VSTKLGTVQTGSYAPSSPRCARWQPRQPNWPWKKPRTSRPRF